jgi:hypothetical protein
MYTLGAWHHPIDQQGRIIKRRAVAVYSGWSG